MLIVLLPLVVAVVLDAVDGGHFEVGKPKVIPRVPDGDSQGSFGVSQHILGSCCACNRLP